MLSVVKIDLSAIANNVQEYRNLVGKNVKIMGIVKSNAYGHGLIKVADFIKDKVDMIGVVSLKEAIKLLKKDIKANYFILSFWYLENKENIKLAIKNNVSFPVYNKEMINILNKIGKALKIKANVYLK